MSVEGHSVDGTAVDAAIVAWFDAVKSGVPPDREEFLGRYPDFKAELRQFFANYDCFRERASVSEGDPPKSPTPPPEMQPTVLATNSGIDSVTTSVRYRELELFKKGGLGAIYRAYDESLHRETAVKFVGDKCAADPALLTQFRVEAEITGRLDHPGVVPVYGIGEDWNGRPFYVMRMVKGRELTLAIQDYHTARLAHPRGAETRRQLLSLLEHLISACKTVAYAHDVGIIHCDIKPANIMVGKYGETFVLDWGLAATFERTSTFMKNEPTVRPRSAGDSSTSGQRGGTYGYISPEQLCPDEPIAPTSDVYSLGATLYEILTGVPPFNGRDKNVADRIREGQFTPPRSVMRDIRPRLEAICLKAMSLSPKGRYSTAKHLARDLTNWMHDDEVMAAPDRWWNRVARQARRHRTTTTTTLLVSLVLAVTATWVTYQAGKRDYVEKQNALVNKSLNTSLDTFEDICRPLAIGELNHLGTFRKFATQIHEFATEYLDEFEHNLLMMPYTGRVYELRATVSRVISSDTAKSLRHYQQAEENYQAQLRGTTDQKEITILERRLAHLKLNQGLLYIQRDQYDEAANVLADSLETLEKLRKKQTDDADLGRDLAEVYHSLGEVHLYRNVERGALLQALRESQDFFEKSAILRTDLQKNAIGEDRRGHQRDLARSHGYLGDLYLVRGSIADAESSYQDSDELREKLYRENPTDPEYRFQFARSLGNFGNLERCYKGNLDLAIDKLIRSEALQTDLEQDFPEVKTFHIDLARTKNMLAEIYLWQAVDHPDKAKAIEYAALSRKAAEEAGKIDSQRYDAGDYQSCHGLAWSHVTLAALEQLAEGPETVALAKTAAKYLNELRDGKRALGRGELVLMAMAASLQGDVKGAYTALNDAVDRGENSAVRIEKHGKAGLRKLAEDGIFGKKYHELCKTVRSSLKIGP